MAGPGYPTVLWSGRIWNCLNDNDEVIASALDEQGGLIRVLQCGGEGVSIVNGLAVDGDDYIIRPQAKLPGRTSARHIVDADAFTVTIGKMCTLQGRHVLGAGKGGFLMDFSD